MTPELLIFFVIAFQLLVAAFGVVFSRNPVYSLLFLIMAFLDSSAIFILLGAEFIAFILAIVYVGAIAILFLFVVMMFDASFDKIKKRVKNMRLFASGLAALLLTQMGSVVLAWKSSKQALDVVSHQVLPSITNTEALGRILYTDFFVVFQLAGFILLVGMIGAIILTQQKRVLLKRQDLEKQLERSPSNSLKMVKVSSKKGLRS